MMDTRDKFLAPVTVPQARSNALIERGNRRVDFGTAEVTGFATSKELRAFSDKLIRSELFGAQIRIHLRPETLWGKLRAATSSQNADRCCIDSLHVVFGSHGFPMVPSFEYTLD